MNERHSVRYQPDPMALGYIDLKPGKTFSPNLVGILLNESYTGCALVIATDVVLKKSLKVKIKIGALDPMKAEIVWIKNLEENIFKVGIKLLE